MKIVLLLLICFLQLNVSLAQNKHTLSGYVQDKETGEPLVGATVFNILSKEGSITNAFGFYSLTLPEGKIQIQVSYLGYAPYYSELNLDKNINQNYDLQADNNKLGEVVIKADRTQLTDEVQATQMSSFKITPEEIAVIPSLGGETDLIKIAQLMPGIIRGGEGTTGMFVRGGTDDQNLVVLDDATVYNLSHLFGFFSIFNNDAIREM